MKKVFISGSISIKNLNPEVCKIIDDIINKNYQILVGDAHGVDALVQKYCIQKNYINLCVYYVDEQPRNRESVNFLIKQVPPEKKGEVINVNNENVKIGKKEQGFKDRKMADDCDYAFAIWDEKSSGSFANIQKCFKDNKFVKIWLNEQNRFALVCEKNPNDFYEIEQIYRNNSGYEKSEIRKLLADIYAGNSNFKSDKSFNEFLQNNKIMQKDGKNLTPCPAYAKYFIEKKIKQFLSYKFSVDMLEIIEKIVSNTPKNKWTKP
ncbi:hypothetical protein [Campylobacter fetus]|uniref:hypothetical protein n=1 Tax=Campylobacter fetus TaxID=196 RepID=UPI000FCB8C0A|nr:hypothetical protein [Campylobacter fetus]RUT49478.1 hypothetical protein BWK67_07965 [Campylobacter fetus]RUT49737.1 hypothetical protein BWK51_07945 [Campylobacter fetus]